VLVLLACDGIEALRMWSLKVQLPRAPGGVIGEAIAKHMCRTRSVSPARRWRC
jgi:S-DNA-T family DNA segregation ATPase FtsK/SpoIIIE